MKRFYNIQAGYSLASRAVDAVYGLLEDFDYFEDFVDHREPSFAEAVGRPQKYTLLHRFLKNFEAFSLESDLYDIPHSDNFDFLESYLRVTGVPIPPWFNIAEIDDHSEEVKGLFSKAAKVTAEAAFEILFNDHEFLFEFQGKLKDTICLHDTPHPVDFFETNGRVKRLTSLPRWLERAVFYRDKGRCQECLKDVSGEVYRVNVYHLDHILPLAQGGTNDPTNFQLLCAECNDKKGKTIKKPKNRQARFFDME